VAAQRRLADVGHEIREMLEVEPAEVAALAGIEPGARCPTSPRSKPSSTSCGATASASAPSTCAPRRSCARSRPSTARSPASATTERAIKRLRQASRASTGGARTPARLLRGGEQPLQAAVQRAVRRRDRELQLVEHEDPLEAARHSRQAARQEAGHAVAALRGEQALTRSR